jgi:CBS domain-containing protein
MTVETILATEGADVTTIEPTATVEYGIGILAERGIGALAVLGAALKLGTVRTAGSRFASRRLPPSCWGCGEAASRLTARGEGSSVELVRQDAVGSRTTTGPPNLRFCTSWHFSLRRWPALILTGSQPQRYHRPNLSPMLLEVVRWNQSDTRSSWSAPTVRPTTRARAYRP